MWAMVTIAQSNTSTAEITLNTASSTANPNAVVLIKISGDQLKDLGYSSAVQIQPLKDSFLAPVFYFKVKEKVANKKIEDEDTLAILVRPMTDKNWVYNNGDMQVLNYNGRTQARVSSSGYYIVVTGLNKQKVTTLANNLKVLY